MTFTGKEMKYPLAINCCKIDNKECYWIKHTAFKDLYRLVNKEIRDTSLDGTNDIHNIIESPGWCPLLNVNGGYL